MTSVKKVKVALLALVAALVIAIPTSAFADTAVTAANTSLKVTAAESGHTYDAYQVFAGDMAVTSENKTIMSNVKWGTGIAADKGDALVEAIKALGDPFADVKSAADIAAALENANDATVQKVAAVIGDADKGYLATAVTLDAPAAANAAGKFEYTKSNVNPGYYFIQDRPGSLTGDTAYTRFMLQVVGAASADAKADKPTVEKEVLEDNNNTWGKDAAWQTHEKIPYRITGSLPSNYAAFKGYYYVFTDRMSPGLTLDKDSIKVYALNGTTKTEITAGYNVDTTGTDTTAVAGETWSVLKVWFGDLQKATCAADITASTKIVVEYTAQLNENAVVGNPGNPNDVKLKYANNPNKDGSGTPEKEPDTGETEWDHAIVFTFELDTLKTGVGDDAKKLQGATFVLYRLNGTTKEYAILDSNNKVQAWTATKAEDATPLTSDATGHFVFKGLDGFKVTTTYNADGSVNKTTVEGAANKTYYLEETAAPTGYQLLTEPVKVEVTATYDQSKYDGTNAASIIESLVTKTTVGTHVQDNIAGQAADGKYNAGVANTKGGGLPSTGGIGTTIFTVVGIALIVAAAAIMVVRRRNAAALQ